MYVIFSSGGTSVAYGLSKSSYMPRNQSFRFITSTFYARKDAAPRLAELLDSGTWNKTPTPRLANLHRSFTSATRDLHAALDLTCNDFMQATDPRDRIVGILGLCSDSLVLDYGISFQSTLLGTALYIPLRLKCWKMLTYASGVFAESHLPSWAPPIRMLWPSKWALQDRFLHVLEYNPRPSKAKGQPASEASSLITPFSQEKLTTRRSTGFGQGLSRHDQTRLKQINLLSQTKDLDAFVLVNSEGALSMKIGHLSQVRQKPRIDRMKPMKLVLPKYRSSLSEKDKTNLRRVYKVTFCGEKYELAFGIDGDFDRKALSEITDAGTDHLFLMEPEDDRSQWLLMVMRETSCPNVYQLVACGECWNIRLLPKMPGRHQRLLLGPTKFPARTQQRYKHRLRDGTWIKYVHAPMSLISLGAALRDFKAILADHCSVWQQPVDWGSVMSNLTAGFDKQGLRNRLSEEATLIFLQALVEDELVVARVYDKPGHRQTRFAHVYLEALNARASTLG